MYKRQRLSDEFFERSNALDYIADALGVDLLQLQSSFQDIWIEIESTLEETLDRETIEERCQRWDARIRTGGHAFGAS